MQPLHKTDFPIVASDPDGARWECIDHRPKVAARGCRASLSLMPYSRRAGSVGGSATLCQSCRSLNPICHDKWSIPWNIHSSLTVMPMFRAVPSTVRIADSTLLVFRSGSFTLAISSTCALVTVPATVAPRPKGWPEPLDTPAAFLRSSDAGGVFRMKVKLRSSNTVISTGMTVPALSLVRALYSLQNIMMFTPAAPSAGPTGGAGLALPACRASLINFVTFFAIITGCVCVRLTHGSATAFFTLPLRARAPGVRTSPEAGEWKQQHSSTANASTREASG
mmetsp:Transcript_48081/g.111378  ORF Transcript_48081/g.111378 Transcript_48081/m.111378 type:complete len:280 (+) Transcript_48081:182-1021(+)